MGRPSIVQLYAAGWSLSEISAETGISISTLHRRLLTYGVTMRSPGGNHKPIPTEKAKRAPFLYERMGWTTPEIARREGVHVSTVNNWLRAHGVVMRDRSESLRLKNARS
jgi:transposase-like protein